VRNLCLFPVLVLAACATAPAPISMPDYEATLPEVSATETPRAVYFEPDLVPYPGIGVSYVANVEEETYSYEQRFYCYQSGRWFHAGAMSGPWDQLSMKYVPVAIYRVRGHLPPALEARAREDRANERLSLVSFQLVPDE